MSYRDRNACSLSAETAQLRTQRFGDVQLERQHSCGQCLAVVVEAQAARYTATKRAFGDEIERMQTVDFVTCDLAADDAGIVCLEFIRRKLFLEAGIEFRRVCNDCNIRG